MSSPELTPTTGLDDRMLSVNDFNHDESLNSDSRSGREATSSNYDQGSYNNYPSDGTSTCASTSTNHQDRSRSNSELSHSMLCLSMFERGVQDPCSAECDNEDENTLMKLSQMENVSDNNNNIGNNMNEDISYFDLENRICSDEEQEFKIFGSPDSGSRRRSNYETIDPLKSSSRSFSNVPIQEFARSNSRSPNTRKLESLSSNEPFNEKIHRHERHFSTSSTVSPPTWTNPFTSKQIVRPQQNFRKVQTMPYISNAIRANKASTGTNVHENREERSNSSISYPPELIRNSRANSANFLYQLSRQPLRPSIRSASINKVSESTFPGCKAGDTHHDNDTFTGTRRTTSRSSCSSILTHLYGIEKYVSSDLDALSTEGYSNIESADVVSSPISNQGEHTLDTIPRTLSTPAESLKNPMESSVLYSNQNSKSDLSLKKYPVLPYGLRKPHRKRRKSYIEKSLANSFA
ncbi:hypothetical protein KAFR_0D03270 [Kazachstania africana CBS 2517]|uniref:Uncharacterized protein n=1 Tax=Kazachstania africana (strain ATCC 22294 / BCRC 22015 / CBS 2517 / CECT 1963 / NBRC 1671 / NRRL Y-8276) TaxID=1071382 RepID=H2AUC5_KAZAF|nr:hypothetical protein KAFR_0D03270 [Kazachstania africana CBS 2517]CCF57975.1 hypothetical protein KAFR_0D03270 [Kazachstania africana CBS 2517]